LREEEDDDDDDDDDKDEKVGNEAAAATAAAVANSSHQPSFLRRQKTAGLNNISNKRAFEYAHSLMFGSKNQIAVPQDRRICKLGSMATQRQNLIFRRRCRLDVCSTTATTTPPPPSSPS
jgi:hypothetical protein